jgi:hypothetical protein
MSSERFLCNSCDQQKAILERRKSRITGMDIFICASCIEKGYEPRHLLIIGYHSSDPIKKRAISLIKNHLYIGEPITLTEVL